VTKTYPLEMAAKALAEVKQRRSVGKSVLLID
jgi:hypothetical protein